MHSNCNFNSRRPAVNQYFLLDPVLLTASVLYVYVYVFLLFMYFCSIYIFVVCVFLFFALGLNT